MKLKDIMLRAIEYAKGFEAALDYDPMDEIAVRIRKLEMEAQLQRSEVAALTAEVRTIRGGIETRYGPPAGRPRRQIT